MGISTALQLQTLLERYGCGGVQAMGPLSYVALSGMLACELQERMRYRGFIPASEGTWLQEVREEFDKLKGACDEDVYIASYMLLMAAQVGVLRPGKEVLMPLIKDYERAESFSVREYALAQIGKALGIVSEREFQEVSMGCALSPFVRGSIFERVHFAYGIEIGDQFPLVLRVFGLEQLRAWDVRVKSQYPQYRLVLGLDYSGAGMSLRVKHSFIPYHARALRPVSPSFPIMGTWTPFTQWCAEGMAVNRDLEAFSSLGESLDVWGNWGVSWLFEQREGTVIDEGFFQVNGLRWQMDQ